MSRNFHDALIEQLLREFLGGDRPRDLTVRTMARARMYDRTRRNWWLAAGSALAACVAISATLWFLWPRDMPTVEYPAPAISEGEVTTNGEAVARGARLETQEGDTAQIDLGHYVQVNMEPQTAMTIGGSKFEEKVSLERGQINVAVMKNKGKFDVVVGPATVHVTGTRFRVGVEDQLLEKENRIAKKLRVAVDEGSVVVNVENKPPTTMVADSSVMEQTFEISSVPLKVKPKIERPSTAGPSATGRGPAVPATTRNSSSTQPAYGTVRLLPNRLNGRAYQILQPEGHFELSGTLRVTAGGIYVLQTNTGSYLIFAQQNPLANLPNPPVNVRVTWEKGKVSRVELDPKNGSKTDLKNAPAFH